MEVKGKIIAVLPVISGEGKNGPWKKQDYVIEYEQNSQYPRKMVFNLWGEKIDQYTIQEGQSLRISFDIDCREYNGRWYNDIRAWKIDADDGTPVDTGFTQAQPPIKPEITSSDETSDLPF
ncbi:MAG: DUF3127 domain-containing protein [Tannerella sp.]|jgi:hypothetical protein|nr:DUF3127 domain-containing protein [Tannerella sp.]